MNFFRIYRRTKLYNSLMEHAAADSITAIF